MATHDYDIANQSGAAFRTDLNNALAAIQSNNSNSSSPATTVAYQWWADTTSGTLKIRNAANNAWIELFQLDGTLTLEDGSASTPALAFRDDLNTGIYSSAADTFNIATGGVERLELGATTVFNEDGANVDFRIEGDSEANLFYIDAGNNRIGIGTSTPQSTVNIFGVLEFNSFDSSSGSGGRFTSKGCLFGDAHSAGKTVSDDRNMIIWNERGLDIDFGTNDELIMKLNSAGNVGIGAASIADDSDHHKLAIAGDSGTAAGILIFQDTSNNEDGMIFADNGSLYIAADRSNATSGSFIAFRVDGSSEKMRLTTSGELKIGTTDAVIGGEILFIKHGGASANCAGFFFNNTQDRTNLIMKHDRATGGTNATMIDFLDQTDGSSGSIVSNGSSTAYNTSSDYRLKENAVAISDGITRLKTLKPYRFNFKVDPTKTVDGFFAHEVTAVPEAVQGEKDEMQPLTYYTDEDTIPSGKQVGDAKTFSETEIRPQSIDHSKLVPLLVASLQEAVSRIEVLETKVAALEAA